MTTKIDLSDFRQRYYYGLKQFLAKQNEELLTQAYELGRESLKMGCSEIDIVEFHHSSLEDLDSGVPLSYGEKIRFSSVYLKEWLAPFEVKLESYRNVIDQLHESNKQLKDEIANRREIQEELLESKKYFQSLIEHGQDIITVVDHSGIVRYNSPSIKRILQYDQNELIGREVFGFLHQEDQKKVKDLLQEMVDGKSQIVSAEYRFKHKKGRWVYFESIAKSVPDSRDGPIIIVNSRDVTDRKYTMNKLREHRAKLAEAQQIARVGSWAWIPGQEPELEWSEEMARIYGFKVSEFDHSFETYINQIHPKDQPFVKMVIQDSLDNNKAFSFEHRIVRPDGKIRYLVCKGRSLTNDEGEVVKMIGTCQDITEQKRKEQTLKEYSNKLRKLSERIERTREEERIRIARELHDELGQMLTVLKMDVSMLNGQMKKKVSNEILEFFNCEAEKILDRINTIINSVQRITTELRPEVLDDLGLVDALQWQGHEIEKRSELTINFNTELTQTNFLADDEKTTIFRVFQETLHNVVRHANATSVEIEFKRTEDNVILSIADNGIGITREQEEAPNSFGIIGIKERVRFLGGDVFIEGERDEGTKVVVKIPLTKDKQHKHHIHD